MAKAKSLTEFAKQKAQKEKAASQPAQPKPTPKPQAQAQQDPREALRAKLMALDSQELLVRNLLDNRTIIANQEEQLRQQVEVIKGHNQVAKLIQQLIDAL